MGEADEKNKFHWRSWGNVCKPISEGGLGVRDFKEIQKSLYMKFAYQLLMVNNLWSEFFRAKYFKNKHITLHVQRLIDSQF